MDRLLAVMFAGIWGWIANGSAGLMGGSVLGSFIGLFGLVFALVSAPFILGFVLMLIRDARRPSTPFLYD